MRYKNIIFDFDGVLAESVEVKTEAFHSLYSEFGKEIASRVVIHHKANGGMSRYDKFLYYHKSYLNISLQPKKLEQLSKKFSKLVVSGVISSMEVNGATWFLNKYKKLCNFWIVSATPIDEIRLIAKKRKISEYFIDIFGSPKSKTSIVNKILSDKKLLKNQTIFLGDAKADYKAAISNDIDFALKESEDNKKIFSKYSEFIRFKDYYELDKKLN